MIRNKFHSEASFIRDKCDEKKYKSETVVIGYKYQSETKVTGGYGNETSVMRYKC